MKQKVITSLISVLKTGNDATQCFASQALGGLKADAAVEPLIEAMFGADLDVCFSAVEALGKIGDPKAVDSLIECYINCPDQDVKVAVIESLGLLKTPPAINQLLLTARYREDEVEWEIEDGWDYWWDGQLKAIEALGELGVIEAIPTISYILDDDENQELSEAIFTALSKLNDPGKKELLERLNDDNALYRRRSALALKMFNETQVKEALLSTLEDQNPHVRLAAGEALIAMNATEFLPKIEELLLDPFYIVVEGMLKILAPFSARKEVFISLLNHENAEVRKHAAKAIGQYPSPTGLIKLSETCLDSDLEVSNAALYALSHNNSEAAENAILYVLHNEACSKENKAAAALALKGFESEKSRIFLLNALKDKSHNVRLNSLTALADLPESDAIEYLLRALRGELYIPEASPQIEMSISVETKDQYLEVLIEQNPAPLSTLEAIKLKNKELDTFRSQRVNSTEFIEEESNFLKLAEHEETEGDKILRRAEIAPHLDIKQYAARLLHRFNNKKVVHGLMEACEDPSPFVQQEAAESLGLLGDPESINAIIPLLGSEDIDVRLKATRALGRFADTHSLGALLGVFEDDRRIVLQLLNCLANMEVDKITEHIETICQKAQALLTDPDPDIRSKSSTLLLKFGGSKYLPQITNNEFLARDGIWQQMGTTFKQYALLPVAEKMIESLKDTEQKYYHRIAIETLYTLFS